MNTPLPHEVLDTVLCERIVFVVISSRKQDHARAVLVLTLSLSHPHIYAQACVRNKKRDIENIINCVMIVSIF